MLHYLALKINAGKGKVEQNEESIGRGLRCYKFIVVVLYCIVLLLLLLIICNDGTTNTNNDEVFLVSLNDKDCKFVQVYVTFQLIPGVKGLILFKTITSKYFLIS